MKKTVLFRNILMLLFVLVTFNSYLSAQNCSLPVVRTTPPISKFDYTYWSSPVTSFIINGVSPTTLVDKFLKFDPIIGNWVSVNPLTTIMEPGKGYIIRGPDIAGYNPYTASFNGTLNSGTISTPINVGLSNLNLIGNPYCDAIEADCFIRDAVNQNVIGGSLYFWTHNIPIDSSGNTSGDGILNYNSRSYAVYNLLGGVAAGRTLNTSNNTVSADRPRGYIASCQSFFVRGLTNGTAVFTESMRNSSPSNNTQFFKTTDTNAVPPPSSCDIDKHRLWLQIENGTLFKETLVGYSDEATTGPNLDRSFDAIQLPLTAFTVDVPYVNLYSLSPSSTEKLTIQGRKRLATFNTNDVIPLGFICPAGSITISVGDLDGLFVNQNFWLKETVGSVVTYHNIKTTDYTFTTPTPIIDDTTRFQIVFILPGLPNLLPSYCGTTQTNMDASLFSNINMPSHYLVTGPFGFVAEFDSGNSLNLNRFGLNFDTEYTIQVANYQIDGVWQYGTPCNVRTPLVRPTKTINTCGMSISNFWNTIYANNSPFYGIRPTGYRFRITDVTSTPTVVGIIEKQQPAVIYPWGFCLNDLKTSLNTMTSYQPLPSRTYSVEVAIRWGGQWGDYGTPCNITTTSNASRILDSNTSENVFAVKVSPNPFTTSFSLAIETTSQEKIQINVYDILGKLIESKTVTISDTSSIQLGDKYAVGLYNVILTQGENSRNLKLIKN
jgi:hypothetical protein